VLAAAVAWAVWLVAPNFDAEGYDLSAMVVGAQLVANGDVDQLYAHHPVQYNLADSDAFQHAAHMTGFTGGAPTAFVHAPLVAWLARPLAHTSFANVVHVWLVLSALALAGALWASLDAFAPRIRTLPVLAALMLAMVPFEPVRYSFWLAQTTPFVVLFLLGSLALVRRERLVVAGLIMSVPAFIKLTPLVFVVVWAWQRRWRALAGLGAGLAALAVLSVSTMGIACHVAYVRRVAQIGRIALVSFNNHSLSAFLTRFSVPHDEIDRFTMFHPSLPVRLAVMALAAALVAVPAWTLRDRRTDPLVDGFAILITLLVPSLSWTHYFVLLVPLSLVAFASAETARTRAVAVLGSAVAFLLCVRPIAPDESRFVDHRGLVIVGPTIAAAILFVVLSSLAVRLRPRRR
jgi:hypothetical protein